VNHTKNSLSHALVNAWALLFGFGILMLGDGLQGTLLAVRAYGEGFSTRLTGLVMSAFYVGFLVGTLWTPRIVRQVGHIRVFAALGSIASAAILLHATYVDPVVWMILRLLSGFCFSGLYVVAESWLNNSATNETRGQLLSVYMIITYAAVGAGQLFLNLADPLGHQLFVLISILISMAVVPVLLNRMTVPAFDEIESVKLRELYRLSPLGVFGMFWVGLVSAVLFSLGPVYASQLGLTTSAISYFMLAPVIATIVLQWPIGQLSDRYDRRSIILIVTLVAAAVAGICLIIPSGEVMTLTITFGLFGGFSLPMYALCVAYTNDHLEPEQMVAASSGLILAGGLGASIGPFAVSLLMDQSADWFFLCMAISHGGIGLFALYRMAIREALPMEDQGPHAPVTLTRSPRVIESMQVHLREESQRQEEAPSDK